MPRWEDRTVWLAEGSGGMISERDYARKVIIKGKSSLETRVEEIMVLEPTCVAPETAIDECLSEAD